MARACRQKHGSSNKDFRDTLHLPFWMSKLRELQWIGVGSMDRNKIGEAALGAPASRLSIAKSLEKHQRPMYTSVFSWRPCIILIRGSNIHHCHSQPSLSPLPFSYCKPLTRALTLPLCPGYDIRHIHASLFFFFPRGYSYSKTAPMCVVTG